MGPPPQAGRRWQEGTNKPGPKWFRQAMCESSLLENRPTAVRKYSWEELGFLHAAPAAVKTVTQLCTLPSTLPPAAALSQDVVWVDDPGRQLHLLLLLQLLPAVVARRHLLVLQDTTDTAPRTTARHSPGPRAQATGCKRVQGRQDRTPSHAPAAPGCAGACTSPLTLTPLVPAQSLACHVPVLRPAGA